MNRKYAYQFMTTDGFWRTVLTFTNWRDADAYCRTQTSMVHRRVMPLLPRYRMLTLYEQCVRDWDY